MSARAPSERRATPSEVRGHDPIHVVGVAQDVIGIIEAAIGGPLPLQLRGWDGSLAGDPHSAATVVLNNPTALRRLIYAPTELGLVRAYVAGDLDFEGDIFAALDLPDVIERVAHHDRIGLTWAQRLAAVRTARSLGALGLPPTPPPEELRRNRGGLHSKARDAASVSHHYDVGNDFYRLVLGASLVYSCAYWADDRATLEDAQTAKLDLVCRKLGLRPGMRLLDVGCGWGSLALHAAAEYGVSVVGITVSREQADLARTRVRAAGLQDQIEIRLQDYRDVSDGPYDAISSVGMSEHVGGSKLVAYARTLSDQLAPGGRLLNHAIASVRTLPPAGKREPGFIDSYIFPDGEILPLSTTLDAFEQVGLEVRDSEGLREHYARTLRAWVANLQAQWNPAVELVGEGRARTWLLYLAASALAFEHGNITIHQVLAVKQSRDGHSGMPSTREAWLARQ